MPYTVIVKARGSIDEIMQCQWSLIQEKLIIFVKIFVKGFAKIFVFVKSELKVRNELIRIRNKEIVIKCGVTVLDPDF